ncbi:hypothetical protein LPJ64_001101 [Coemansia asiatica]|uniref:Protein-L-isoaspartate O-methyltransferase n=1 Tax=Coemansia asiatica TaxID=1052880 RepID=A0A9W7XLW4_9FUNG|nr:hypothetical protein LPJ64_001101 [Coemansia asiatica]KAJ2888554.1 hypothetical protein FB639_000564 [Coemansia asiatica]
MAWTCSGKNNDELVTNLQNEHIITNERVVAAMRKVDRAHFADFQPYQDSPQSIGHGATISAPHMHGYALEHLEKYLQPGMKALDVGSGSGYLTACMAAMVGENGRVVGIDHIPELVKASQVALDKHYSQWTESGRIKIVLGDGRQGYMPDAPYDCIHVGAAAPKKPEELLSQLKLPGRMFAPVGTSKQRIVVYDKDANGQIVQEKIMGVLYVPLTDPETQRSQ